MMAAMDRTDPIVREAMDQAARVAEWILEKHNSDVEQELALDVLTAWLESVDDLLYDAAETAWLRNPRKRLAWALMLTEKRTDLEPHEQRLLDDSWEKVREDQVQREWEEMGL